MIINSNSFHYKWYVWTYRVWDKDIFAVPRHTNLCQYVQRIFWHTLLVGVLLFPLFGLVSLTYYLLVAPVMFVFGYTPINLFSVSSRGEYIPFNKYRGLRLWGMSWYPIHGLLTIVLAFLQHWAWHHMFIPMLIGHTTLLGLAGAIICYCLFSRSQSEGVKLVRAWVSARKQDICPLVEFKNAPTTIE
jgi:hypothetical protein